MSHRILIDGREFVAERRTGIARFLEGLLLATHEKHPDWRLTVAIDQHSTLPTSLGGKAVKLHLPNLPELFWPALAKGQDLFVSPYPKLPLLKLPCPAIHTVHDVYYLTHPACRKHRLRTMISSWVLRRSISNAVHTWFTSKASQEACEILLGTKVECAEVYYSPVKSCFIPSSQIKAEQEPAYFLCVGNGGRHKNVELLLQAIRGTNLVLKCVGVGEEARARIRASCPDVAGQVEFLTAVDDMRLAELYREATALLFPSLVEGYGFPPLEAMACGTPAIVSDIPVLHESTGDMATYCSPHDTAAWQGAMLSMLDMSVRQRHSQNVLQWVQCRQGLEGWHGHIEDLEAVIGRE
ncbi:glycosyltransferase family 4 protein [Pseudomonadota bacterium]